MAVARRKKKRREEVVEEATAYVRSHEVDEEIRDLEEGIRESLAKIEELKDERKKLEPNVGALGRTGATVNHTWEVKREWMYKIRRFSVQVYANWRGSDSNAANSDIQRLIKKGLIEWVPGTNRPKAYRLVAIERKRQERFLTAEGREDEIRVRIKDK